MGAAPGVRDLGRGVEMQRCSGASITRTTVSLTSRGFLREIVGMETTYTGGCH
jgi:hypothetical protein